MSPSLISLALLQRQAIASPVEVQDEAGETVGTTPHLLTTTEVAASKVEINIETTVPAAGKDT